MHKTYQHSNVSDADQTLNSILDIITEGVWDWDCNSQKFTCSPGWYRMLGYTGEENEEGIFAWENIIHADDFANVMYQLQQYTSGKVDHYQVRYRCKKSDGSYLWVVDSGEIVARNSDGSVARMIGTNKNILSQAELIDKNKLLQARKLALKKIIADKTVELEKKNQELKQKIIEVESISNTDSLTNIANRKFFETELTKEMNRAQRYRHKLTLVMFDLDKFKEINDQFGHQVGDEILCQVSELVSDNIRTVDLLARWGGDEFVIIFPELSKKLAHTTCEKLRVLISELKTSNDIDITCSFGVAQYKKKESIQEIFKRVDKQLYIAKEQGRNQVCS